MRFSLTLLSALMGSALAVPAESKACGGCCCASRARSTCCMPAMSMNHSTAMNGQSTAMNGHSMQMNGANDSAGAQGDAKIKAALAKLSPEDRRLAEAQALCPIAKDSRLGSMGTPIKVLIKGEPVFLCCAGCKAEALANPEATLAKVAKLKARAKAAEPDK